MKPLLTPLLIDTRSLLKLGLMAMVFAALVFAAGFISGYERASAQQLAGEAPFRESVSLELSAPPVQAVTMDTAIPPAQRSAGADIDVDLPDTPAAALQELEQTAATADTAAPDKRLPAPKAATVAMAGTHTKPAAVAERKAGTQSSIQASPPADTADSNRDMQAGSAMQTAYSIQAGTYRSLDNARQQMQQLRSQQRDAYITDYYNRKQQRRYNVRFGYYSSRRLAREQLAQFRREPGQDGYIVPYSDERLVDGRPAGSDGHAAQPADALPVSSRLSRAEALLPASGGGLN